MQLRPYTSADAATLAEVYRRAVLILGPQAYTSEQTDAWSQRPQDDDFATSLTEGLTLCAEVAGQPVAFGSLHPGGYVAYLYCDPHHARRGYASAILSALEAHARSQGISQLTTEASCLARPCFEKQGFTVEEEERIEKFGVEFLRFRMVKRLEWPSDYSAALR